MGEKWANGPRSGPKGLTARRIRLEKRTVTPKSTSIQPCRPSSLLDGGNRALVQHCLRSGPPKGRGELFQIAAPDTSSNAAKQENEDDYFDSPGASRFMPNR